MGGSAYGRLIGLPGEGNALGPIAPPLGVKVLEKVRKLHRAISRGLVRACHDCSEGGLAVALAEMSLAGGLGAKIRLMNVPGYMGRNDVVSFSETPCRFVVEVPLDAVSEFGECMSGVMCRRIGEVVEGMEFVVTGIDGEPAVVRTDVAALRHAFCGK
jgi:phosphoribosylformylglycinamidine synthase